MKRYSILLTILCVLVINTYILSYKYSFFSDVVYETTNYINNKDNLVVMDKKIEIIETKMTFEVLNTYEGTLTAYGADCYGCSGITSSGFDLRDNNIFYEDNKFGTLRIVAADKGVPLGTVVRISNVKIYDKPIVAIVLDRGYAIKGNIMDLAFGFQDDPDVKKIGRSNVVYETLRYGW